MFGNELREEDGSMGDLYDAMFRHLPSDEERRAFAVGDGNSEFIWFLSETANIEINQEIASREIVERNVQEARSTIFKDCAFPNLLSTYVSRGEKAPAPFPAFEEALEWIEFERNSDEGRSYKARWLSLHDRAVREIGRGRGKGYLASDNPVLPKIRSRLPFYFAGSEAAAELLVIKMTDLAGVAAARVLGHGKVKGVPGIGEMTIATERVLYACTERLALLAHWSEYLARLTDYAWRKSQCAEYILTGELPKVPRWRVRQTRVGLILEVYSVLTRKEVHDIYLMMRDRAKVRGRKDPTSEDLALFEFMKEHEPKSLQDKLDLWNAKHPERQFGSPQALHTAHTRIQKRFDRFSRPRIV